MNSVSRRTILRGGFAAGAAILLSNQGMSLAQTPTKNLGDTLETILNVAITAETFNCTHYYTALTEGNVQLTPQERNSIAAALDADLQHYKLLTSLGARSSSDKFYTPKNIYNSREIFSNLTEQFETAFVAAYLAANRRITELGNPLLAATIAQIAVVESVHLALIRQLGGRLPNNISLGQALYYNISDSVSVLQPLLQGGQSFTGPRTFPGEDAIRGLVGNNTVTSVIPFTDWTTSSRS